MTPDTNSNRIIYSLDVNDLQRVANDKLSRGLKADEIKRVEDKVGDYISWYDAIAFAINDIIDEEELN